MWQAVSAKQATPSLSLLLAECMRGNFNAYLISISSKSSAGQLRWKEEERGRGKRNRMLDGFS